METMREVLAKGNFILQDELESFESNLCQYLDVDCAFGVGNGTDAILLALRAVGVGGGDEVILPAHTFVATASAVHHAGATPVFADIGDDHMLDPDAVEEVLSPKTKAVIPVQLNGRTCNMDALVEIAERHDLKIIEDSAQALGAEYEGKKAGTFGVAGTFSFYPAKLLGAFGDAGAIVTSDPEVAKRVAWLRDHGRTEDGDVRGWSYNSRLDTLHAAVLDLKLANFDETVRRRREIASRYQDRLGKYEDLHLPPAPTASEHRFDVYQNYEIEFDGRDELKDHLARHGIGTIVQWGGKAIHQFEGLGLGGVSLPITERVMRRSLLLPLHPFLTDDDVEYVCTAVEAFFGDAEI